MLDAGSDAVTALAEAFGTARTVDVKTGEPWLVKFTPAPPRPRLLNLTGTWPTRARASQAIWTSPDRRRTQQWAAVIAARFGDLGGPHHGTSMRGGREDNVALRAPAEAAVDAATVYFAEPLAHPPMAAMIRGACDRLGHEWSG